MKSILRMLTAGLVLSTSACATVESYGEAWFSMTASRVTDESPPVLARRQNDTRSIRGQLIDNDRQLGELEACEALRSQLVAGAEGARQWVAFLWAFPLFWPAHLVTLFIWPTRETLTSASVTQAAETLEVSYQSGTPEFLGTCSRIAQSPVGRTFTAVRQRHGYR